MDLYINGEGQSSDAPMNYDVLILVARDGYKFKDGYNWRVGGDQGLRSSGIDSHSDLPMGMYWCAAGQILTHQLPASIGSLMSALVTKTM